ncbi:related to centromere binding factor 1 [Ustilago trichophora]|uniref:Related to centromere binding factor 1 n=1 Tax=Ustilago trichophora TaxID=86804 RepID=A0A5C3EP10_9BASI|nr:related to centromere binding factor 1 [Ustilago trichophora]
MSATTEAAIPPPTHAEAEHLSNEHPDETSVRNDASSSSSSAAAAAVAAAALENASDPADRDHIERDVSNILAGLNQEQLASIVAAARASEARNNGQGGNEPATFGEGIAANSLPPGLGQAASALTSIASGFKRTPGNDRTTLGSTENGVQAKDLGDAPPPPGTEYQAEQLNGEDKELDPDTSAAIAAVKSATDTATAAAIASLGSLAAASHLQHTPASHPSHEDPGDESMDYADSPTGNGSASPSRNPLKRPRGPELDRQRKDNHKEVERRRRSAINDGITQLSHIVPGCDAKNTNKGAIIHAAVRYIQDLKHNEASNIEKWTLEKLLMDQAMGDLTAQLDEARAQVERLRAELDERFADDHQHHHADGQVEQEAAKA